MFFLHNRGEKKIAQILSISPRTVETHINNIKMKLSGRSRDQIIDFLESSGKLEELRKWYGALLIYNIYLDTLSKIGYIQNPIQQSYCFIVEIQNNKKTSIVWEINAENDDNIVSSLECLAYVMCSTSQEKADFHKIQNITNSLKRKKMFRIFFLQKAKQNPGWIIIFGFIDIWENNLIALSCLLLVIRIERQRWVSYVWFKFRSVITEVLSLFVYYKLLLISSKRLRLDKVFSNVSRCSMQGPSLGALSGS